MKRISMTLHLGAVSSGCQRGDVVWGGEPRDMLEAAIIVDHIERAPPGIECELRSGPPRITGMPHFVRIGFLCLSAFALTCFGQAPPENPAFDAASIRPSQG